LSDNVFYVQLGSEGKLAHPVALAQTDCFLCANLPVG
jgi:hypothetical protein